MSDLIPNGSTNISETAIASHESNTAHSSVNLTSLPAEIRRLILMYTFDDSAGQYESDPYYHDLFGAMVAEKDSRDPPPHELARVSRVFAEDMRQIWPHIHYYNRLIAAPSVEHFAPEAFYGIQHLTVTMHQAVHILQFIVPHLPPDYTSLTPPPMPITMADGFHVTELKIVYVVSSRFDLIDGCMRRALWRLQYFRTTFDVTVEFMIQNESWDPPILYATMRIEDLVTTYHFYMWSGQFDDLNADTRSYTRWDNQPFFEFLHSPQRKAIIKAHSHYRFAPLGWLEHNDPAHVGRLTCSLFKLPPRLQSFRPWDVNPLTDNPVDLSPPQPRRISSGAVSRMMSDIANFMLNQ